MTTITTTRKNNTGFESLLPVAQKAYYMKYGLNWMSRSRGGERRLGYLKNLIQVTKLTVENLSRKGQYNVPFNFLSFF